MGARLILYDLEVSPCVGFFYPPTYQTNILKIEKYQILMSFSWAVFEEDRVKVKCVKLDDFAARFKSDRWDDTDVVLALYKVLGEADHTIAYNGDGFDIKMANTFFLKHKLPPLPENKTIDPLKTARQKTRGASNRLDEVAKEYGFGGKTAVTVGALWYPYLYGTDKESKKAGKLLKAYNDQDIRALREAYLLYRPLMKNHPNVTMYTTGDGCPNCGGKERDYLHSPVRTATMTYRRLRCQNPKCLHIYRERVADKDIQVKPEYSN